MDRKRVNGPEASVAPVFKNADKETVAILNSENKRLDDRGVEDVRPICKFFIFNKDPVIDQFHNSLEDRTRHTGKWISIY